MLNEKTATEHNAPDQPSLVGRMLRIEWLGQTAASLCWIISVFVYGLESAGDYLQLSAASAWFIANLSSLLPRHRN